MAFKSISLATIALVLSTSVNASTYMEITESLSGSCPSGVPDDCASNTFSTSVEDLYTYKFRASSSSGNSGSININLDYLLTNNLSVSSNFDNPNTFDGAAAGSSETLVIFSDSLGGGLEEQYNNALFLDEIFIGSHVDDSIFAEKDNAVDLTILLNTDYYVTLASITDASFVIHPIGKSATVFSSAFADANVSLVSGYNEFQLDIDYTNQEFGNVSAVPVPAAVWLFGSGLLGLVGVARRKKA